jgi:predicted transcriptional regulator
MSDQEILRRLLAVPGVTTVNVAEEAQFSQSYIAAMQKGHRRTKPEVLVAARRVALREIIGTAEIVLETLEEREA